MRELLATGLSAAEAAREAAAEPRAGRRGAGGGVHAARLPPPSCAVALEQLDDGAAHTAFDRLLADYSIRAVLADVVLPLLRELGAGWERGARFRWLRSILRRTCSAAACSGWRAAGTTVGAGAPCSSPCPAGERHDLGLVIFGLALRELGWRITFLGADTPPETVVETARRLGAGGARPCRARTRARLDGGGRDRRFRLADTRTAVWIGGAGAAEVDGARVLAGSPLDGGGARSRR